MRELETKEMRGEKKGEESQMNANAREEKVLT